MKKILILTISVLLLHSVLWAFATKSQSGFIEEMKKNTNVKIVKQKKSGFPFIGKLQMESLKFNQNPSSSNNKLLKSVAVQINRIEMRKNIFNPMSSTNKLIIGNIDFFNKNKKSTSIKRDNKKTIEMMVDKNGIKSINTSFDIYGIENDNEHKLITFDKFSIENKNHRNTESSKLQINFDFTDYLKTKANLPQDINFKTAIDLNMNTELYNKATETYRHIKTTFNNFEIISQLVNIKLSGNIEIKENKVKSMLFELHIKDYNKLIDGIINNIVNQLTGQKINQQLSVFYKILYQSLSKINTVNKEKGNENDLYIKIDKSDNKTKINDLPLDSIISSILIGYTNESKAVTEQKNTNEEKNTPQNKSQISKIQSSSKPKAKK